MYGSLRRSGFDALISVAFAQPRSSESLRFAGVAATLLCPLPADGQASPWPTRVSGQTFGEGALDERTDQRSLRLRGCRVGDPFFDLQPQGIRHFLDATQAATLCLGSTISSSSLIPSYRK